MSERIKAVGTITTGDGGKVPGDFRQHLSRYRVPLMIVVGALIITATIYLIDISQRPSLEEQQAVQKSNQAAHGFKEISQEYALTRMNVAVQYAYDKKCPEARAVFDDVTGRKNGLRPLDVQQYQKKLDSLCTAN
jgi:hypothetical protein